MSQQPTDPGRAAHPRRWRGSVDLFGKRLSQSVLEFTAGGRWTYELLPSIRRNLRWFWLDGFFASASESIVSAYLSLFLLAIGASRGQIGVMDSLANLSAALLLWRGATLSERWRRRRSIVVLSANGSRIVLLVLALVPLMIAGPIGVYVAIGLIVIRTAFIYLGVPAWTVLMADIVPLRWRGRYFSSLNIAMVVAGIITTLVFGQLITLMRVPAGYQMAIGLAFVIGTVSTYSFSRIEEQPVTAAAAEPGQDAPQSIWRQVRAYPSFLAFCATAAVWSFALNIGGPFFNIYLVEGLGASAGIVGALAVVSSLAALPGHRLFGLLTDRWGPRRVQALTGLVIPLMPLAWLLARSPWHVAPISVLGGFLWAGYGISSLALQLKLTPGFRRAHFTAILQTVALGALAAGSALGAFIAQRWGYHTVFAVTAACRLVAALLFLRLVHDPAPSDASESDGPATDS